MLCFHLHPSGSLRKKNKNTRLCQSSVCFCCLTQLCPERVVRIRLCQLIHALGGVFLQEDLNWRLPIGHDSGHPGQVIGQDGCQQRGEESEMKHKSCSAQRNCIICRVQTWNPFFLTFPLTQFCYIRCSTLQGNLRRVLLVQFSKTAFIVSTNMYVWTEMTQTFLRYDSLLGLTTRVYFPSCLMTPHVMGLKFNHVLKRRCGCSSPQRG